MGKILVVNNDFDMMTLLQTWLQRKNMMLYIPEMGRMFPK